MAEQALFSRAVGFHLPSAIPVQLERVDQFAVGKVLIYHKKPRTLFPWRKHELNFTSYSLPDLLVKDSNLKFATASNFLFDIGKGVETVDTKLGFDAELKEALIKLNLQIKGKREKKTTITTDFGKITYTSTDLYHVLQDKPCSLDTSNPIVNEAIAKGATIFVISTLYEAEHSKISVKVTENESETRGAGFQPHEVGRDAVGGDADENVAHLDTDRQVTNRDIPTPVAFLLLKLTIGSNGELRPKLRSGLGHSTKIDFPFDTLLQLPPTEDTDDPQFEFYTHGLKSFQAFATSTYEGILTEIKKLLEPLLAKPDLHAAFLDFTKPPNTYQNLQKLTEYLEQLGDALRTHRVPYSNKDVALNPVLQSLSPCMGTQLDQITALILTAEACSELPQHTLQKLLALDQEKKTAVLNLIKGTPNGTSHHLFMDEGPFKDPILSSILNQIGYSCPDNKRLLFTASDNTESNILAAASIVIMIAPPLPPFT